LNIQPNSDIVYTNKGEGGTMEKDLQVTIEQILNSNNPKAFDKFCEKRGYNQYSITELDSRDIVTISEEEAKEYRFIKP